LLIRRFRRREKVPDSEGCKNHLATRSHTRSRSQSAGVCRVKPRKHERLASRKRRLCLPSCEWQTANKLGQHHRRMVFLRVVQTFFPATISRAGRRNHLRVYVNVELCRMTHGPECMPTANRIRMTLVCLLGIENEIDAVVASDRGHAHPISVKLHPCFRLEALMM